MAKRSLSMRSETSWWAVPVPSSFTLGDSPGEPLPEAVRARMEAFFQTDFSTVRVHVGTQAPSLGALALAVGEHLFFAPGCYAPHTERGQWLLGHELAHVVQQRSGRVPNPFDSGLALIHDPVLEAEADHLGFQAAAARASPAVDFAPFPPASRASGVMGRSLQATFSNRVTSQAQFLNKLATRLFTETKKLNGRLMEVQASVFDKKLYIASNYSLGEDDTELKSVITTDQATTPTRDEFYKNDGKTYLKSASLVMTLVDSLHAEQQILRSLAKYIVRIKEARLSTDASFHVTIVGSKRPCSVCHRVLLAFHSALQVHYPGIRLHFVNLTGKGVDASKVEALDLSSVVADNKENTTFGYFAKTYAARLEANFDSKYKCPGELEHNSIRTNAVPDLSKLL